MHHGTFSLFSRISSLALLNPGRSDSSGHFQWGGHRGSGGAEGLVSLQSEPLLSLPHSTSCSPWSPTSWLHEEGSAYKAKHAVYRGFVRPVLEYCPLSWLGASQSLNQLDQVQHRALKGHSGFIFDAEFSMPRRR